MRTSWPVVCSLLVIAFQLFALIRLYQQTRRIHLLGAFRWMRRGWMALMAAIVLMVGRRITALLLTYQAPPPSDWVTVLDRYVMPGSISLLLWLGIEGVAYGVRQLLAVPARLSSSAADVSQMQEP